MADAGALLASRPDPWQNADEDSPFPVLGFREYWYPALPSRQVRDKPVHVELLGEHVVLFRDARTGKAAALPDRCAHRGMALSKGHIYFPGTITCAYHGWTFDGAGECRGALSEGADCPLVGKVRIRPYPIEEVHGLIFLWMGEGAPVPLAEDVPGEFLLPDPLTLIDVQIWNANWRAVMENDDGHHAPILHRHSVQMTLLYNMPPAVQTGFVESPDGQGLGHYRFASSLEVDYPGLGTWPPRRPWLSLVKKVIGAHDRQKTPPAAGPYGTVATPQGARIFEDVRLPGWRRVIARGYKNNIIWVWGVPIDEHTTRHFFIDVYRVEGPLRRLKALALKLRYWTYHYWVDNRHFNGQDREAVESLRPGPHRYSGNDRTILAFRKVAATRARDVVRGRAAGRAPAPESRTP